MYDSRENCNAIIETSNNRLILGCKNSVIPNCVTTIAGYSFDNCIGLTCIAIPASVTSIEGDAFGECINLSDVYCFGEQLPTAESSAFSYSPVANMTLHVPAGALETYKVTEPWSTFGDIVALTEEELNALTPAASMKWLVETLAGGVVSLQGATENVPVAVYTTSGYKVASGVATPDEALVLHTGLATGDVATVTIGEKSVKVVF